MSERDRFRGQDPRTRRNNPLSRIDPSIQMDDFLAQLGPANSQRFVDEFTDERKSMLQPVVNRDPLALEVPVENIGFVQADPWIRSRMDLVTNGTRKQRETAQRELIQRAQTGTTDDLLDVINCALASIVIIRETKVNTEVARVGVKPRQTLGAFHAARDFLGALTLGLAAESRPYYLDWDQISNRTKFAVTTNVFLTAENLFSQEDYFKLPASVLSLKNTIYDGIGILGDPTKPRNYLFFIDTILSFKQAEQASLISIKPSDDITADEFELLIKAKAAYPFPLEDKQALDGKFRDLFGSPDQLKLLRFLNQSLHSQDKAVVNATPRLILSVSGNELTRVSVLRFFQGMQRTVNALAQGKEVDPELENELEGVIRTLGENTDIRGALMFYTAYDYEHMFSSIEIIDGIEQINLLTPNLFAADEEFIKNLWQSQVNSPVVGFLSRVMREASATMNAIPESILLELFDPRRALGFFLENLEENWQDLQAITRQRIWPGFIGARRAKLWPSEHELDNLEFAGGGEHQHPAATLGFETISFFTAGYTAPEVGLRFGFPQSERILGGRLDSQGRLCDLPFDLEESHPYIHALLEFFAVTSFQELVTIADKRFKEKGEGKGVVVRAEEFHPARPRRLPRVETSYVTLSPDYERKTLPSGEVIEQARTREGMRKLITQKVVPLPYAARYQLRRQRLAEAIERGDPEAVIKTLEGQMIETLAQVPKTSQFKLDNLPPIYKLEPSPINGRYLETWRKTHYRPALTGDEELPEVFERVYRAAPVTLAAEMESWFTQPPKRRRH